MKTGSCICEGVIFEIDGDDFDIIQCHCSKCRKITGGLSDAMIVVPVGIFTWIHGTELIKKYTTRSGSARSFCQNCGGSLPGRDGKVYWVPAGMLDSDYNASVKAHIYVGSKLPWDDIAGSAPQYDENITK